MKKSILRYLILFLLLHFGLAAMAISVGEVISRSAAKANGAKSISCVYSLKGAGGNTRGTLLTSGNKFQISSGAGDIWYDGRNMWTYNPSSKETTLTEPTQTEVMEVNPLNYLKSYKSLFNLANSKRGVKGKYVILLTPKNKKFWVRQVEVVIDPKSFDPSAFIITAKDGRESRLDVISLKYGKVLSNSSFVYPSGKYKNVEIIDLR